MIPRGARSALAAAFLFGAAAPLSKLLLDGTDGWLLAGLCYLASGLGLSAWWMVRPGRPEAPLRRPDLPWLAASVLCGGVLAPGLLMEGLRAVPASTAALLLNMEGVLTILLAWAAFREHLGPRVALGAAATLGGAVVLSGPGGDGAWSWGALAVMGACAGWALDNNLTRRISGGDAVQLATVKGVVAGSLNLGLALARGAHLPGPGTLLGIFAVGVLGYGASLVLYVRALRELGTARTGTYFALAPFVGAALAVPLLGEAVTLPLLAAGGMMALGVALQLSEHHEHPHHHDPVEHDHAHTHDEHHAHDHEGNVQPGEPHTHVHRHDPVAHSHPHYPDLHHRHGH